MPRIFCRLLLLLSALTAAACATQSHSATAPDLAAVAQHRTVAIMPFAVELDRLRLRDIRYAGPRPTPADLNQQQQAWAERQRQEARTLGYQLQQLLAQELQARQPAQGYTVQFQDVRETNRRLAAAGIGYDDLPEHSMDELRQALGVDALLSGETLLYQPMPNGVNLAARVLLSDNGVVPALPSNTATTNLMLHDCRSGRLVWRFDFARAGSASLNPTRLTKDLVRAARPGFPYGR